MNQRVESFLEHERRTIEMDTATARDVARLAGDRISVKVSSEPGSYLVQTHQYVGSLVVPSLKILIRPKIQPRNLFLLLGAGLPSKAWLREHFRYEVMREIVPALAAFFARTLEQTLASGLLHAYREERDRVPAIRGQIDFSVQIRHPGLAIPVACRFAEFTADIPENRILKTAIRRLLRMVGIAGQTRQTLVRELSRFEEVLDEVVHPDVADQLTFSRLSLHYKSAIELAALILRSTTLMDRPGSASASAFLVDMNDVFQRFITDRLTRALPRSTRVSPEPRYWLGVGSVIDMYPDLVFERGGRPVYVADVKYKLTRTGKGRSDDYYQLLAYTTAMGLSEGVLIYARVEGDIPPRVVHVRNGGQQLYSYALDLSGPTEAVEREIVNLAEWISSRCEPSEAPVDQTFVNASF